MKEEKPKSEHRQIVEYFYKTAQATRGFAPKITVRDTKNLKNAIDLRVMSKEQFEQVMLYFLADPSYRNLGPSIATMLSSTVINSLINKVQNRVKFWKELDGYVARYVRGTSPPSGNAVKVDISMEKCLAELVKKLTVKHDIES